MPIISLVRDDMGKALAVHGQGRNTCPLQVALEGISVWAPEPSLWRSFPDRIYLCRDH